MPAFSYKGQRRPLVDPAMRRIVVAAGGVSMLVIAVALVWSGVKPHIGFGPPPVITAPPGPLRVLPSDPGGLTVPGANEQIMSGDVSNAAPQLAASGPAPAISQLQDDAGEGPPAVVQVAPAAVAAPVTPAPVNAGTVQVQLAATVDEAGAKKAWSQLQVKMPGLLTGHTPIFMPAVVDGQNIWRLRMGGFADIPSARAFCAQVIAAGGGCAVAGY
jgi:hypothetical protein